MRTSSIPSLAIRSQAASRMRSRVSWARSVVPTDTKLAPRPDRLRGLRRRAVRVGERGDRGVAAIERDHASGRMRGRAAEVEPGDRRARAEAVLPHLIRRDLALEDVAAGEANARLDVGRPEHLIGDQTILDARCEAIDQLDELARDALAPRVPIALGEVVRRVLAEDAHQVLALRRGRRVVTGLKVDLAEGDGRLAAGARLEGALGLVHGARGVDRRPRGPVGPGRGGPLGQAVEGGVELHHRAAHLPLLETLAESLVHALPLEQAQRDLRVRVREHHPGPQRGAVLQAHSLAGQDLRDRHAAGEQGARLGGGIRDREAAHPHPALDVAPYGALAVEVALVVHELDRGGAGLAGAAPGSDDPLAEQRGLQPLVVEVLIEHIGDRSLEQEIDHLLVAVEELLELRPPRRIAYPGVASALSQLAAHLVEELLISPVAVDVGLRDPKLL